MSYENSRHRFEFDPTEPKWSEEECRRALGEIWLAYPNTFFGEDSLGILKTLDTKRYMIDRADKMRARRVSSQHTRRVDMLGATSVELAIPANSDGSYQRDAALAIHLADLATELLIAESIEEMTGSNSGMEQDLANSLWPNTVVFHLVTGEEKGRFVTLIDFLGNLILHTNFNKNDLDWLTMSIYSQ